MSLPVITPDGGKPIDMATGASMEALDLVANVKDREASTFVICIAVQTYYKMVM